LAILEVGCGSGTALRLAADRGADVTALEAASAFVHHALRRVPGADIRLGDLQFLPFGDESFDVVMGFNSFQYAADVSEALSEARRVLRSGGLVAMGVWGPQEECEIAAHLAAVKSLLPPPPEGAPGPFACSQPGFLRGLLADIGLSVEVIADIAGPFEYADEETARRALLSSGPCVGAARVVGEERLAEAIMESMAPYRRPDGSYRTENTWRVAVGRKP
jgi:SAM-dependent methyltransferase